MAGFISAERIEAGTISTAKVTADFGDSLTISNNPTITGIQTDIQILPGEIKSMIVDPLDKHMYIQLTDPTLDAGVTVERGDYWVVADRATYDPTEPAEIYCWDKSNYWVESYQWIRVYTHSMAARSYSQVEQTANEFSAGVRSAGAVSTMDANYSGFLIRDNAMYMSSTGTIQIACISDAGKPIAQWENAVIIDQFGIQLKAKGAVTIEAGSEIKIQNIVDDDVANSIVLADGQMTIGSSGNILITAGGTLTMDSQNFELDADGNVTLRFKGIDPDTYATLGVMGIGSYADLNNKYAQGGVYFDVSNQYGSIHLVARNQRTGGFGSEVVLECKLYAGEVVGNFHQTGASGNARIDLGTFDYPWYKFYGKEIYGQADGLNFYPNPTAFPTRTIKVTCQSNDYTATNYGVIEVLPVSGSYRVNGNIGAGWAEWQNGFFVNLYLNGTPVTTSSRDKKHDIAGLVYDGTEIDRLNPVRFKYNNDEKGKEHLGLIYEEVEEVLPEICSTSDEGGKYLAYTELIPVLIQEIQQLRKRVKALEA